MSAYIYGLLVVGNHHLGKHDVGGIMRRAVGIAVGDKYNHAHND